MHARPPHAWNPEGFPALPTTRRSPMRRAEGLALAVFLGLTPAVTAPLKAAEEESAADKAAVAEATTDETTPEAEKQAREAELKALSENITLSKERQAEIEREIAAIDQDRASLTAALIRSAERIRKLEKELSASEDRLTRLGENEDAIRASLAKRRGVLAEVLAALERLGRKPPPAIAVRPEDALSAVRSAILLGGVLPELRVEAEALAADLSDLTRLKTDMTAERDRLAGDAKRIAEERARMEALFEAKKKTQEARTAALQDEKKKAEELAEKATSLKGLIAELEAQIASAQRAAEAAKAADAARRKNPGAKRDANDAARLSPAVAFADTRGKLRLPATGVALRNFGENDGIGGIASGLSLATRAGAQVIAPADGWVVYAGRFRSYGQLLILNAGDGYHVLLAGMGTIDVELGQFVLAGEPVGEMGRTGRASAATLDIGSSQPVLYIEFRKDGKPIDSAPWWAPSSEQKVSG